MKLPHKTLEKDLFKKGYHYVIAVDEVGIGCLAGPVVVCAVAIPNNFYKKVHKKLQGIRDSKLLSSLQRNKFAAELLKIENLKFKIAYCYPKTIDSINIYQAARQAMRKAISRLNNDLRLKTIVLVDGKTKIEKLTHDQMAIIKGDRKVFAIACASVIAKVYRDKMMKKYAKRYPGYGFEKHKGYGTKYHITQLASLGPSEIHRRSFAPVGKLI